MYTNVRVCVCNVGCLCVHVCMVHACMCTCVGEGGVYVCGGGGGLYVCVCGGGGGGGLYVCRGGRGVRVPVMLLLLSDSPVGSVAMNTQGSCDGVGGLFRLNLVTVVLLC